MTRKKIITVRFTLVELTRTNQLAREAGYESIARYVMSTAVLLPSFLCCHFVCGQAVGKQSCTKPCTFSHTPANDNSPPEGSDNTPQKAPVIFHIEVNFKLTKESCDD